MIGIILCSLSLVALSEVYNRLVGAIFGALEAREPSIFWQQLILSVLVVCAMAAFSALKDYFAGRKALKLRAFLKDCSDDTHASVDAELLTRQGMSLFAEGITQVGYIIVFSLVLVRLTFSVWPLVFAVLFILLMLQTGKKQIVAKKAVIKKEASFRHAAIHAEPRTKAFHSLTKKTQIFLSCQLKTHFVQAFGGNIQYALCLLVLVPNYFSGHMALGTLMQSVNAMQMVVLAILSFNRQFDQIAEYWAAKQRLGTGIFALLRREHAQASYGQERHTG